MSDTAMEPGQGGSAPLPASYDMSEVGDWIALLKPRVMSLVVFTALVGLLAGALIFSAQDARATVFGLALWFAALFVLRLMAKADPKLRHVYLRHRRYKGYYPARSTPFRDNTAHPGRHDT